MEEVRWLGSMMCRAGVIDCTVCMMRRRCAHVHGPSGGKASSDRENGHTAHVLRMRCVASSAGHVDALGPGRGKAELPVLRQST